MFLKKNYTLEKLKKEERFVYFDIDNTLGSSNSWNTYKKEESYQKRKREELKKLKERTGVYAFSFSDYISMDEKCLFLFMKCLEETKSKCICISSWTSTMGIRYKTDKNLEEFTELDMLNEIFKGTLKNWNPELLLGGLEFCGDRGNKLKKFIEKEKIKGKHILLDDSAGVGYKENEYTISVNGDYGFTEKEYELLKNKLLTY